MLGTFEERLSGPSCRVGVPFNSLGIGVSQQETVARLFDSQVGSREGGGGGGASCVVINAPFNVNSPPQVRNILARHS